MVRSENLDLSHAGCRYVLDGPHGASRYRDLRSSSGGPIPERASKDVREHIVACEECQRIVTARLAIKLGLVRVGPHRPIWLD